MTDEKPDNDAAYNAALDNFNDGMLDLVGAKIVEEGDYGKRTNSASYAHIYTRGVNSDSGKGIAGKAHALKSLQVVAKGGRAYSGIVSDGEIVDVAYTAMFGEGGSFYNLKISDIAKKMNYEGEIDPAISDKSVHEVANDPRVAELLKSFQEYLGDTKGSEALALNARANSRSLETVLKKPENNNSQ